MLKKFLLPGRGEEQIGVLGNGYGAFTTSPSYKISPSVVTLST